MNCDVYCALRASAFSVESLMMMSGFSTGMLLSPDFFFFFDIREYFLWVFCDVDIQDIVDVVSVGPLQ